VEKEYTLHNSVVLAINVCTKNYQSWLKFDKVMIKTILTVFDTRCIYRVYF